jgi:hypothetical protein
MVGGAVMTYRIKPLSCDPAKIKGMSERLIVSHYENNYSGAVKRLNQIDEQLAELDYAKAAGFLINGLKLEQLVAIELDGPARAVLRRTRRPKRTWSGAA